jgi:hypothetical protein
LPYHRALHVTAGARRIAERPRRQLQLLLTAGVLLGALSLQATPTANAQDAHPQTIIDAAGLSRLQGARTGSHRWLADVLKVGSPLDLGVNAPRR